jgi:hypothetical protein
VSFAFTGLSKLCTSSLIDHEKVNIFIGIVSWMCFDCIVIEKKTTDISNVNPQCFKFFPFGRFTLKYNRGDWDKLAMAVGVGSK